MKKVHDTHSSENGSRETFRNMCSASLTLQPTKRNLSINHSSEEDYILRRDIVQFGKNFIDVKQERTSSRLTRAVRSSETSVHSN